MGNRLATFAACLAMEVCLVAGVLAAGQQEPPDTAGQVQQAATSWEVWAQEQRAQQEASRARHPPAAATTQQAPAAALPLLSPVPMLEAQSVPKAAAGGNPLPAAIEPVVAAGGKPL